METPYNVKAFSIGCVEAPHDNADQLDAILSQGDRFCPESFPPDRNQQIIQMGLHSRAQRYELMSCIPVGILIRTIRDRYFQLEMRNLEEFYKVNTYDARITTS